jgi:hypothetical protein
MGDFRTAVGIPVESPGVRRDGYEFGQRQPAQGMGKQVFTPWRFQGETVKPAPFARIEQRMAS